MSTTVPGGSIYQQPKNMNMLQGNHFELVIAKLPNTKFFCQKVKLPMMETTQTVIQKTPYNEVPLQGQKILFSELEVTFKIHENMENYSEIVKWIFDGTLSRDFQPNYTSTHQQEGKVYSDGEVHILTSRYSSNMVVRFKKLFPVSLSGITLSTTEDDINYMNATAKFKFTYFDFVKQSD